MLRVAPVGVLLASLAFVSPAAARAHDCATTGHTVSANAKARVYRVGDTYDGKYYGCTYGSERRKLLGIYSGASYYQEDTGFFCLRGRRVGYAQLSSTSIDAWEAKVVDLRTRKVTRRASADGGLDGLRMTGTGSLALLSDDGNSTMDGDGDPNPVSAYTVTKVERDGGTVLDRGKRIDPGSLALVRHRVYWMRAGKPHSAEVE